MARDPLIDRLADDLEPVSPPAPTAAVFAGWLALAWTGVVALTLATGPLRPGAFGQLAASPRFLAECGLGLLAGTLALAAALRLAVPGVTSPRRAAPLALGAFAAWLALHLYGLAEPALAPSMAGKREHCFLESLLYAVPALGLGVFVLRRHVVLDRAWTAGLLGAAAATPPAVLMQIACMYDPGHVVTHHLSAVPLVGAAAVLLARRILRSV